MSVDSSWAHKAFQERLGIEIPLLSDFHPKGEVSRAYGAYIEERGHANRSLVLIDEEGIVRWVHESPRPLEIPGANLIFDALAELRLRRHEPLPARRCPAVGPETTSAGDGRR